MNWCFLVNPAIVGSPCHRSSDRGAEVPLWVTGVAKAERLSLACSKEPGGQKSLLK